MKHLELNGNKCSISRFVDAAKIKEANSHSNKIEISAKISSQNFKK